MYPTMKTEKIYKWIWVPTIIALISRIFFFGIESTAYNKEILTAALIRSSVHNTFSLQLKFIQLFPILIFSWKYPFNTKQKKNKNQTCVKRTNISQYNVFYCFCCWSFVPFAPINLLFTLLELLFDDSFTDVSDLVLLSGLFGLFDVDRVSHSSFDFSVSWPEVSVEFRFVMFSGLLTFADSLDSSSSSE